MKQDAIVVDLDGTLCDDRHRHHHIAGAKKHFDKYYEGIPRDPPVSETLHCIKETAESSDAVVIYLTGRPEKCRSATIDWLLKYDAPVGILFMRPNDNYDKSAIFKENAYIKQLRPCFNILMAYDDMREVLDMWQRHNIPTREVTI